MLLKSFDAAQTWQTLLETADKIKLTANLSKKQNKRIKDAADVLRSPQSSQRRKKYRLILHKILRNAGPGAVLLCAVTLGQVNLTDLKDQERVELYNHIKPQAIDPDIKTLATYHGIPSSIDAVQSSLSILLGPQDPPTDQSQQRIPANYISCGLDLPSSEEQRVIENAQIHGIAKVFSEYLCSGIRRVEGDLKAAVTMAFPLWGGLVHCLLTLDICEQYVEELAMALFNAKIKWVDQVLHLVLDGGITLVIPNSEATLKGVKDETILEIFGTEIFGAITECPVHRRELLEGKNVTECVSMILTKKGAFINLSLGLEGGLQLQNKIYL